MQAFLVCFEKLLKSYPFEQKLSHRLLFHIIFCYCKIGDEELINVSKQRSAYRTAQSAMQLRSVGIYDALKTAGLQQLPQLCFDEIASYLTPTIAGPPVFTIAKHQGLDDDQSMRDLCDKLGDLFEVNYNEFTKGWLLVDFIVNDIDIQDELRAMREEDKFQVHRDKHKRLVKTKFMEWKDFDILPGVDLTELNRMKLNLDRLTGRNNIEDDWTNSGDIGVEEKNQYRLCYNHLLHTCMYIEQE